MQNCLPAKATTKSTKTAVATTTTAQQQRQFPHRVPNVTQHKFVRSPLFATHFWVPKVEFPGILFGHSNSELGHIKRSKRPENV